MDLSPLFDIALIATTYLIGRGVGLRRGREESTSTVVLLYLDGTPAGSVRIDGVTVIPNATHIDLTRPDHPPF